MDVKTFFFALDLNLVEKLHERSQVGNLVPHFPNKGDWAKKVEDPCFKA